MLNCATLIGRLMAEPELKLQQVVRKYVRSVLLLKEATAPTDREQQTSSQQLPGDKMQSLLPTISEKVR